MATKAFKRLPRDAKRAAFAQMDKDGTRRSSRSTASFQNKQNLGGYRFSEGVRPGTLRIESPGGQIALTPRGMRSNQQIIKDLKKGNPLFK